MLKKIKATTSIKYSYWAWLLLDKNTKESSKANKRDIVAVYNQTENKIFRYDIQKNKRIDTNWKGLEWLFENCLQRYLNIDEVEKFFTSLPKDKQSIFWDCFSRGNI